MPQTSVPAPPTEPPVAVKTTKQGARTRERIMDAAEQSFAQRGYDGTTLRDIAGSVGISVPSLYNHVDGKESLYAAVLERGIGPILRVMLDAVARGSESAAAGPEIIEVTMRAFGERPQLARLVQHEALSGGERLTPMLREYLGPVFAAGAEMTKPRAEDAGWEEADVPHLVLAMIQVVLGFFTMAPLTEQVNGQNLLTSDSLARQTRFVVELSERLFSPPQHSRHSR